MFGGLLALIAVGFSLIFGVLHVINLSHGMMVLTGAYAGYLFSTDFGIDPLLSLIVVAPVMFGLGYLYQFWLIERVRNDRSALPTLLLTFGVALILKNAFILRYSSEARIITTAYSFEPIRVLGLNIDTVRLIACSMSIVLLGLLAALLRFTEFGRVIRATAQDTIGARICGINVKRVYALTFAISAALAAASGVLLGLALPFSPEQEGAWTFYAFIAVALGGVGSPAGAFVGGCILGLISTCSAALIGPAFSNAVMFMVMVLVILVRPQGIFGGSFRRST